MYTSTSTNVLQIRNWQALQVLCACIRWQQLSEWNDTLAAFFKLWHQIENTTLSTDAYLREEHFAKFHSDRLWNDRAFGLFEGVAPTRRTRRAAV